MLQIWWIQPSQQYLWQAQSLLWLCYVYSNLPEMQLESSLEICIIEKQSRKGRSSRSSSRLTATKSTPSFLNKPLTCQSSEISKVALRAIALRAIADLKDNPEWEAEVVLILLKRFGRRTVQLPAIRLPACRKHFNPTSQHELQGIYIMRDSLEGNRSYLPSAWMPGICRLIKTRGIGFPLLVPRSSL